MRILSSFMAIFVVSARLASAQACPPGQPSSPWPGPLFVPSADCRGWVPANHPQAPTVAHQPAPTGEVPTLAAQDIYSGFTGVSAVVDARVGLRAIAGWAVDCALGTMPPKFRLTERKPDGSTRDVPNDFFWTSSDARPDVQSAVGASCPAVYNVPALDGARLGANDGFGWSLLFRSPIVEPGVHTFTVIWEWPAQRHSGSSSISVTVQ